LNGCLKHEPDERFTDIASLMDAISVAEFTKKCGADHPNPYWALRCIYSECGLGFSKPGIDEDLVLHDGWIGCPAVDGPLPVAGYRQLGIKLWPKQHPQYHKLASTGVQLTVKLYSADDSDLAQTPLRIKLLPAPDFDFRHHSIEVERNHLQAGTPVIFPLLIKRSKVMIQHIKVEVNGQDRVATCDPAVYGRVLESRTEPYSLQITFDPERLSELDADRMADSEGEPTYDLTFELHLKNRFKPHRLSARTLNHPLQIMVVSRPGLGIKEFEQGDNLIILAYKDPKLPKQEGQFDLFNSGRGQLRVSKVVARPLDDQNSARNGAPILVFESFKTPKRLVPNNYTVLNYTVYPQNICGNYCQLEVIFNLEAQYRNASYQFEETRRCLIETKALKKGGILAVDFGTTNTMCAVLEPLQDDKPEILKLEQKHNPDDLSIPSIIEYGPDGQVADFGHESLLRLKEGSSGIFQSFKRDIADDDKLYTIYPKQGDGVLIQMYGDELCCDFIHTLYQSVQPLLGRRFQSLIFTHPTLFSTRKRRAYEAILAKCGFNNYTLMDEAMAGAYEYISEKRKEKDNYGLLVYDFGGGTIDITYIHVVGDSPAVLGAGGMPHFGGDDVTSAIEKIVIDNLKAEGREIVLPGSDRFNRLSVHERRQIQCCRRVLWGEIEHMKKGELFQSETANLPLPTSPPFLVWQSGRTEKLAIKSLSVSKQSVYAEIYSRIAQSVNIAFKMLQENAPDEEQPLENYILLSGQSSRIPLVMEMFEAFRNGERPFWDKDNRQIGFHSPENIDAFKMNFAGIELSPKPKACVAEGAAYFKRRIDADIHGSIYTGLGLNSKTVTRIGTPKPVGGAFSHDVEFEEWIPVGRHLVPTNGDPSPQ
jgi:hypothetical protein